jgi:hypothetical protein
MKLAPQFTWDNWPFRYIFTTSFTTPMQFEEQSEKQSLSAGPNEFRDVTAILCGKNSDELTLRVAV